jgi:hypothetical protein
MAFTSAGYDGTVDEKQFAGMLSKGGASEYGVDLAGDFAVTAVAGQDRTVSIAPGTAWGHSVVDVMDVNETRALAAPASGSRWDMIVLRRDWQPPGGATTVAVVQGGPSSLTLPGRAMGKGVIDEQPLALVRVDAGSTTIGQIIDLRCWGRNGGVTAKSELVMQYLGAIGAEVRIGRSTYSLNINQDNSTSWIKSEGTYMKRSGATGYTLGAGVTSGPGVRINFPEGIFLANEIPNIQLTVVARTPGYAIGRFNVEARNVSHTGFEYWAYRTDLSDGREEVRFTIHWLAMM